MFYRRRQGKPEPLLQKWSRRFKRLSIFVAVVFVVGLITMLILDWRIEKELAAIRARGEPTSYAEIETFLGLNTAQPPDPNAMQFLTALKALEKLNNAPDINVDPQTEAEGKYYRLPFLGAGDEPKLGAPWPELKLAEEYLAKCKEPLDQIQTAIRQRPLDSPRPIFRPEIIHTKRENGEQVHSFTSDVLRGSSIYGYLRLRFELAIAKKDQQCAFESLSDLLRWLALLSNERTSSPDSAYLFLVTRSQRMIERALAIELFDDRQLLVIQQTLRRIDLMPASYVDEAVHCALTIESIRKPSPMFKNWGLDPEGPNFATHLLWRFVLLQYLYENNPMIDAQKQSPAQSYATLQEWVKTIRKSDGLIPSEARQFVSGAYVTADSRALLMTRIVATDIGIAVCRFRRKNGTLPATLEALVPDFLPEVPEELFAQSPFQLKSWQNGFDVNSSSAAGMSLFGNRGGYYSDHAIDAFFGVDFVPKK